MKSKSVFIAGMMVMMSACSHIPSIDPAAQSQDVLEQQELENANIALRRADYDRALADFQTFQSHHPQSMYTQAARMGEAEALEGLERYGEAAVQLRDVYLQTVRYQPEIAAKAMYQLSFAYEAQGDDVKTVTTLLDAQKLGKYLSPEIAQAEIPARLAMVYAKFDREKEAREYLSEADRGLQKLMNEEKLGQDWLAKTYYQMGSISTAQVSPENFSAFVQGQKMVQTYLLRGIALNQGTWSQKSLGHLKSTYRDLYSQLNASAPLTGKAERVQQRDMGSDLIDLINQAELYKPVSAQSANPLQKDFFAYIASLKTKTEALLYQTRETMTLTEESERLNSLKRAGRVRATGELLPQEKEVRPSLPQKLPVTEDPNL